MSREEKREREICRLYFLPQPTELNINGKSHKLTGIR